MFSFFSLVPHFLFHSPLFHFGDLCYRCYRRPSLLQKVSMGSVRKQSEIIPGMNYVCVQWGSHFVLWHRMDRLLESLLHTAKIWNVCPETPKNVWFFCCFFWTFLKLGFQSVAPHTVVCLSYKYRHFHTHISCFIVLVSCYRFCSSSLHSLCSRHSKCITTIIDDIECNMHSHSVKQTKKKSGNTLNLVSVLSVHAIFSE